MIAGGVSISDEDSIKERAAAGSAAISHSIVAKRARNQRRILGLVPNAGSGRTSDGEEFP
jgi:hypothetical protein